MRLQADTTMKQDLLGQYMTPPRVASAMAEAVSVRSPWTILDPACGDGNLLIAAMAEARKRGVEVTGLIGFDIDSDMIARASCRLSDLVTEDRIHLYNHDFLSSTKEKLNHVNIVLANPPYGWSREYDFVHRCVELLPAAEFIFLVPLAFIDRVVGLTTIPLPGRPLRVTTGNAIVKRPPGQHVIFRPVKERPKHSGEFRVLTGLKLYERGAGFPPQTAELIAGRPYSSSVPRSGWLPCARTGDVTREGVILTRLWVDYGDHLAHPKDTTRFTGPRLFVRRVPIWEKRQLCAAYLDTPALAAGDLLVVKHSLDDQEMLHALAEFINSPAAAAAMHQRRPTVLLRDSFPKFSAKDLRWLIDIFEERA